MSAAAASPLLPAGPRHRRRTPTAVAIALLLALGAVFATAVCTAPPAAAQRPPQTLIDSAERIAEEFGGGSGLAWARYVPTTKTQAAPLLARPQDVLDAQVPEQVYLVVLRGAFRDRLSAEKGEYLAYIFWEADGSAHAAGFTVSEEPFAMKSVGVSRPLHLELVTSPPSTPLSDYLVILLYFFLPPVLLVAGAALCAWRRRCGWPYVLAACLALAVAAWQSWLTVSSISGWGGRDPTFHGIKLGILAVVVLVDLAAAAMLLVARRRREMLTTEADGHLNRRHVSLLLLVMAAIAYLVAPPLVGWGDRLIVWFLPPLLLLVAAALCAWRWQERRSWVLAACLAALIGGLQLYEIVRSTWLGWGPSGWYAYGSLLLAIAATVTLVWARPRRKTSDDMLPRGGIAASSAGILLLIMAAVLYLATLPYLGTTGA